MIRRFEESDIPYARAIHRANELPENCFPNLNLPDGQPNALFIIREVFEENGQPAMMCFCKITAEIFFLIDHTVGTPEERWKWLQEFTEHIKREAWKRGLEQLTAWVPPEIEISFAKRLKDLGFQKSEYVCWTLNLED